MTFVALVIYSWIYVDRSCQWIERWLCKIGTTFYIDIAQTHYIVFNAISFFAFMTIYTVTTRRRCIGEWHKQCMFIIIFTTKVMHDIQLSGGQQMQQARSGITCDKTIITTIANVNKAFITIFIIVLINDNRRQINCAKVNRRCTSSTLCQFVINEVVSSEQ